MASGHCVPHQQAAHMAAPTRRKHRIKETLAKGEPSTHDPTADVASDNAILWRAIAYSQGRRAGWHPKHGVWCVGQLAFVRGRSSATSALVFAGLLQVAPSDPENQCPTFKPVYLKTRTCPLITQRWVIGRLGSL